MQSSGKLNRPSWWQSKNRSIHIYVINIRIFNFNIVLSIAMRLTGNESFKFYVFSRAWIEKSKNKKLLTEKKNKKC